MVEKKYRPLDLIITQRATARIQFGQHKVQERRAGLAKQTLAASTVIGLLLFIYSYFDLNGTCPSVNDSPYLLCTFSIDLNYPLLISYFGSLTHAMQ